MRNTIVSWNGLPTICMPTGRPPAPKPGLAVPVLPVAVWSCHGLYLTGPTAQGSSRTQQSLSMRFGGDDPVDLPRFRGRVRVWDYDICMDGILASSFDAFFGSAP